MKLLKTLLLLSALVVGLGNVWADPVIIYSETFGSPASNTDVSSYTGWSATSSMFNLSGSETVSSCYSGNKVGTGNASTTSDYTVASGNGNAWQTGTKNTETTILTVQKIKITGKSSLALNFAIYNNGAASYVKAYYQIDSGSETELTLSGYGSTTGWHYVSTTISGTGTNLKLIFKQTPSKAWTTRIDDIKLTGVDATTVSTPQFYPVSGAVASGTAVTISCDTDGASIYYTTDGTTPTSTSTPYDPSNKPTITAATTLKAIAVKDGMTDSDVVTASYTIAAPCETPEFSEPAGELEIGTSVEISCDTDGATIYYTTDGTNPTTSSTVYSSALTINTAQTIKAIAVKDGMANSAVASVTYTVHDYTSLPFNWFGGGKSDLTNTLGVTANGLGSDYAAANAPYQVKLDDSNDYIQIKTNAQPSRVYIGVKMVGGATTSTITVKASADGETFDTGEALTISGSQYDIVNLVTTRSFASTDRYIRLVFTKGSNVGVGPISVIAGSTVPATLNASGYATFASGFPLDFSDDSEFSAWQITAANSSTGVITFSQITGVVPSCTGVLLKKEGASSNNINIPVAGSGSFDVSSNLLKGITYPTTVTASQYYGLKGENFVPVAASTTVPAGKALLPVSAVGSDVKAFNFVFEDDADGISLTPALSEGEGEIYNLAGQRLNKMQKGINIVNGKKVLK